MLLVFKEFVGPTGGCIYHPCVTTMNKDVFYFQYLELPEIRSMFHSFEGQVGVLLFGVYVCFPPRQVIQVILFSVDVDVVTFGNP